MLETLGADALNARVIAAWQANVEQMRTALGWPDAALSVRRHRDGTSLGFAAPIDQLFSATEVNEWAWQAARSEAEMFAPGHALATDRESALHTLQRYAAAEQHPHLICRGRACTAFLLHWSPDRMARRRQFVYSPRS